MQDRHLYEYAVIRVLPRVEREEFLNVGIVLFCKRQKFLKMRFHLDVKKLTSLCADCDVEQIEQNLKSFEKIAKGDKDGGPIALLETSERFRWLTAIRSSVIQTSRPHPGLCNELEATFNRLFDELVM